MDDGDRSFFLKAAGVVGLCIALVVVIGYVSTRVGKPDTVPLLRVVDGKWVVLYETNDGSGEESGFDRLVVVDAATSQQLALKVVDARPLAITGDAVVGWERRKGLHRWALPTLEVALDPAGHARLVPALAAGVADEEPCVDEERLLARVLTKAGDHVTFSLVTGAAVAEQVDCNRLAPTRPRPVGVPASFVKKPGSERYTLAGTQAEGWLEPLTPVVDLGISPDVAVLHRTSVGGPLALARVTPAGTTRWTTSLDGLGATDHALAAGGALVLSGGGTTFAVDLETGAVRWQR